MLIQPMPWIQRKWRFDLAAGLFPAVVERLRGVPARADELMSSGAEQLLSRRRDDKWSAKEHLAHLDDLHRLDEMRLDEFVRGANVLSAADMTNARTQTRGHNATPWPEISRRLRLHRQELVESLSRLSIEVVATRIRHPRLDVEMSLVDWVHFVAEHDDHHFAQARRIVDRLAEQHE